MSTYEYGRIARLAQSLEEAGIDAGVASRILESGEAIHKSTKNAAIAAWMQGAMERMDQLLEP